MTFDLIRKLFKNHFLVMAFLFAVPLVGIALLSYTGVIGAWGFYLLLLLCPLGHLLLMRGMHGDHHPAPQESFRERDRTAG